MIKKTLDEKYSYQIDEHNVVHLFRGEEDCQQYLTNPLVSAIFKIEELEAENKLIKNSDTLCKLIGEQKINITKLEEQIEKMKSQYNYAFNQLCKSREILCSILRQYRDGKEIDYFTRGCAKKLLKQGVYKYDAEREGL